MMGDLASRLDGLRYLWVEVQGLVVLVHGGEWLPKNVVVSPSATASCRYGIRYSPPRLHGELESVSLVFVLLVVADEAIDHLVGEEEPLVHLLVKEVLYDIADFDLLRIGVGLLAKQTHHEAAEAVLRDSIVLRVDAFRIVRVAHPLQRREPRLPIEGVLDATNLRNVLHDEDLRKRIVVLALIEDSLDLPKQPGASTAIPTRYRHHRAFLSSSARRFSDQ